MAFGSIDVDSEGWKARALHIVHSSPDPARSLQLMRDKAASLFGCGGLRCVNKVALQKQQLIPAPAPPPLMVPGVCADGRHELIGEVCSCGLGPGTLELGGVVKDAATQVDHFEVSVVHAQPYGSLCLELRCSGRRDGCDSFETRRADPLYRDCRRPICCDGGFFPGVVHDVPDVVISEVQSEIFEEGIWVNST